MSLKLKPLAGLLAALFAAPAVLASSNGLVISQVYGGGGNTGAPLKNDFIEVFNAGSSSQSLAGWSVQYASASGTSWQITALPGISLTPGQYLLVQQAAGAGSQPGLPTPDVVGTIAMSGTAGKVALVSSTTALSGSQPQRADLVDLVGFGGANGSETAPTPLLSNSTAALRKTAGCVDSDNNSADFEVGAPAPRNSSAPLNVCGGGGVPVDAPIVPSCPNASAAAGTGLSFVVSASDADSIVNAASAQGAWAAGITLGAFSPAPAEGRSASQTIEVSAGLAAGSYSLSLLWSNDEAQSASCSFTLNVSGQVGIPGIQGSGSQSPLKDQTVTTQGVVTHVVATGFYLQDKLGDGDAATSDGLFVYTGTLPTVQPGQEIRLSGKVSEFVAGASSPQAQAHPITQLINPSGITVLGSGYAIPPTEVDLVTLPAGGLEAYEGMLVTLRGPLMVQQNYFLGRYGQLTLAAGGRLLQPTNILRPGAEAQALAAENLRRSILLDDNQTSQNPNPPPYLGEDQTVRAGDTAEALTGVIDFGLATSSAAGAAMYKLQPVGPVSFARSNPRAQTPPALGGNLRVGSANVLNYFTTFTNGQTVFGQSGQGCSVGGSSSASNCRGANNLNEFQRQHAKIVASLVNLNADVLGLMEIQNNGNTALNYLVSELNAVLGGNTYAAVPMPAQGTGSDAIRVAMIYKPAKLSLVGASISDTDPVNSRPTFAQGFAMANGERFAVLVNHLKSKGSCPGGGGADADQGDGQGCWNAKRVAQAERLRSFVGQVQALVGSPDVVLLGDFNAHGQEDPIHALTQDSFVIDQLARFDPADYSYVFDAWAGRLDHGLATASLTPKIVAAATWHINADEPLLLDYNTENKPVDYYTPTPFKSSDHDPLLLGLQLLKAVNGTSGRDTLVGTAGDDLIYGGFGADSLSGGAGADQFVYKSLLDAGDLINDFVPGQDLLVLSELLQGLGIASADPLASGHIGCTSSLGTAQIRIDTDGSAGPAKPRALVQLKNVSCAALGASSFRF